jgi:hypothetical protein
MTNSIKRSLVKTFLNTGTILAPTWSLLGDGVPAASVEMNPKITEEQDITQDSASVSVDSYAPKMPVEAYCKDTDAAFVYLDTLRYARAKNDEAETEVVNVWLYEDPALGFYRAEKQSVSISFDKFGSEGGKPLGISYTINYLGDPIIGQFNPTTLSFVAEPILAVLATMVIGSVTLTPLFATNKKRLYYAGAVANGTTTVAMTSTCIADGAVVVQYNDAVVIAQAGSATLEVGENLLSISVTVGDEEVLYHITVTRAAA